MPATGVEMSTWRRTQFICSALLGALVVTACGGPPGEVAPAQQHAHEQPAAQQQPAAQEQSVGQQQPAEQEQSAGQQPTGQQPGGASRPKGGLAQAAESGKAQESTRGQRRPSGNAPGVGHKIPDLNSDLDGSGGWQGSLDGECLDADLEPGCLTLDLKVYKKGQKGQVPIPNPGPDYDYGVYTECPVVDMNPKSPTDGGPKKVPAKTAIRVTIVCAPAQSDQTNPPDQQPGAEPDDASTKTGSNGSDASGQQPQTNKNKSGTQSESSQTGTSEEQPDTEKGNSGTESGYGG